MSDDFFDLRRNALTFVGAIIYLSIWFPVNDAAPQSTVWTLVSVMAYLLWHSFWMEVADGLIEE
jgi:hypothetical protein